MKRVDANSTWFQIRMLDILLSLVAVLVPVAAFYRGLMNADLMTMYAAAVLPAPPIDWPSALITYVWRGIIFLG